MERLAADLTFGSGSMARVRFWLFRSKGWLLAAGLAAVLGSERMVSRCGRLCAINNVMEGWASF